ncbi:hypothetical protein AAIM60_19380 [Pseudomonas lijiangensis]|uniref:hypothetical protein n=1 Tax=Pseudomonas lijiangensis TaxID=2995658 RepID=UPI0031BA3AFF
MSTGRDDGAGDIKQAIYDFHGSDSALMQAILKSLPQLGTLTARVQELIES